MKNLQFFIFLSLISLYCKTSIAQSGWYIGVNAGYDQLRYDGKDDNWIGPSYDLDFGFRFNDRVGLVSTLGGSFYEGGKSKRGSIDFGPRFILNPSPNLQPFIDIQATASTVDNGAFNFSRNGFGGTGSIGVHYFLNQAIALNGIASVSRVYYNDVKFAGLKVNGLNEIGTYYRLRLGIAFYFR